MIPVITSNNICNNHPSNPHSHPFPTFSTSKKSTCSNFWDATTSNQARRLRDVMTSLQDGLQNCRSFNAGDALFAPGRKKRTLSHIDVLQKKTKQSNTPENPWFTRQVYREASPLNFASFWLEKSFGSRLPGYRTSTALQICDRSIQQTCA